MAMLQEKEKEAIELEMARMAHELEMARLQAQDRESTIHNIANSSSINAEAVNARRKFTLPKLEFRQFGGDVKEWLPFWSQFQHIDKDADIALEDKFHYLIQATVMGSRAREIVESFPPTGANYTKAIDSLKSRFGNEDLLVEIYARELLKLIINVQLNRSFPLTSLYDKLEIYLRALDTLGVTTDKCASILYPMVESCFPEEFLKPYHRSNSLTPKLEAKERLNKLMVFLKEEVEGEALINLAMEGFGLLKVKDNKVAKKEKVE
ncbi:uncharacterized protein [Parasteatoda tepidariorum]|uniref:uncharacterized protein n=1 Tax=Parasteatoda tepidariorum TaxID=114398 RepID=UPI00077FB064|nr:uncharacterized protein LOC107453968 [Parasteatoda tepidariorum]